MTLAYQYGQIVQHENGGLYRIEKTYYSLKSDTYRYDLVLHENTTDIWIEQFLYNVEHSLILGSIEMITEPRKLL